MRIGEMLKEVLSVIRLLVDIITAKTGMETESIRHMLHGKDKMGDNGLKAMKYIQKGRGFPYRGMYSCLFLSKYSISILSDTISHLNNEFITNFSNKG